MDSSGKSLSNSYAEYQNKNLSKREFKKEIALYVYHYPKRFPEWTEDLCSIFFLECYDKIDYLINRYENRGFTFETYLNRFCKWRLLSIKRMKKARKQSRRLVMNICIPMVTAEKPITLFNAGLPEFPANYKSLFQTNKRGAIDCPVLARRFLFLCLKYPYEINHDDLPDIALLTRTPLAALKHAVSNLRSTLTLRKQKIKSLEEKRNLYFYKITLNEQIILESERTETIEDSQRLIRIFRQRLQRINDEINRTPLRVTHRDIGLILRIPKGTVDSGLHALRKSLKDLSSHRSI